MGGGLKPSLNGRIDVVVLQALTRQADVDSIIEGYGQIVVDECHHVGAQSIERVLSGIRARYVLGLTATPERRDGLQPIVFMHCDPVRHRVRESKGSPVEFRTEERPIRFEE